MTSKSILIACCLILSGVSLYIAPDSVAERLRGTVADLFRPGLEIVRQTKECMASTAMEAIPVATFDRKSDPAEKSQALAVEQERNRALLIRLAQLTEQRQSDEVIPSALLKSKRLILPTLVEVAVLGDTTATDWCAGKLLDQGAKSGLRESELVLASRKSKTRLIDLGEDGGIATEDSLLLGRSVIGKVDHVGRWTSTVQLVTDSKFTGRAQLIRETSEGFVFDSAEGILLKGLGGPLCKLEGISAENSVHVHDLVFTKERDGILPVPLYYGQVVEATLGPDDVEWTVYVKPAPLPAQLTTVQVLRIVVNPERLVVN